MYGFHDELEAGPGVKLVVYSTPCLFAAQPAIEAALAELQRADGSLANSPGGVSGCNRVLPGESCARAPTATTDRPPVGTQGMKRRAPRQSGPRFAGHRRTIVRYLLLSILILAPFVISFPYGSGIQFEGEYLGLAIVLCILAIARAGPHSCSFACCCSRAAFLHQHLSRHWGGGLPGCKNRGRSLSASGRDPRIHHSHIDAIDVAFLVGAACYVVLLFLWTIRNRERLRDVGDETASSVVVSDARG